MSAAIVPAAWTEAALCTQVDPELFFPDKGGSTADARRICMRCDVRAECLKYALDVEDTHGVWGGLSTTQRRKLLGDTRPCRGGCGSTLPRKRHVPIYCDSCMPSRAADAAQEAS